MNGLFRAIIFVTGGAIIALELLASRIMTPYFGVSLYIWTGILSITLIALALGYYGGGLLAHAATGQRGPAEQLIHLFLLMPSVASLALALACLVYPWAFYGLASIHLVLGAFAACIVLLFLPLLASHYLLGVQILFQTRAVPQRFSRQRRGMSRYPGQSSP